MKAWRIMDTESISALCLLRGAYTKDVHPPGDGYLSPEELQVLQRTFKQQTLFQRNEPDSISYRKQNIARALEQTFSKEDKQKRSKSGRQRETWEHKELAEFVFENKWLYPVCENPQTIKILIHERVFRDFSGGPVDKNPPASAEDTGSIPGPGRSHMPQSNSVLVLQRLTPMHLEPTLWNKRSDRNEKAKHRKKGDPCSQQPEKA
ncbi:hypothetical protein MJT46_010565 [Ovis ammon polii x Ovis aries]|nr:hypothetical protein MJT46_010565 [Ovis ammon polii x Ovis aries]